MFCPNCRTEIPDDAKYCIKCGYDITKIKTPPEKKSLKDSLDISGTIIQQESALDISKAGTLFANRYEKLSEGLRGGMGVVYKCKDTKLKKIVALKLIHPKLLQSEQALQRFRQEVSISQELQHPNIVKVFDLQEWEGKEYFTMEWVEGITLREIINQKKKESRPFSLEEAFNIISQLTDALQYAHRYTIHRDIKPENILITDKAKLTVKLSDFGIAKMLSPSQFTSTSMQMGTPYYMAPEQKTDAAHVDKRGDIYALGVMLFELLTLENTIGLEMPSEINKAVSREIDNVIKKALATKPEQRYGDAKELSDALQKCLIEVRRGTEEATGKAKEQRKQEEERRKREAEEAERKRQEEQQARKEKEENRRRVQELIDRGKASERSGRYEEALNLYREAAKISINIPVAHLINEVEKKIKEEEKKREEEKRLQEERKRLETGLKSIEEEKKRAEEQRLREQAEAERRRAEERRQKKEKSPFTKIVVTFIVVIAIAVFAYNSIVKKSEEVPRTEPAPAPEAPRPAEAPTPLPELTKENTAYIEPIEAEKPVQKAEPVVTDTDWKASKSSSTGWTTISFNDSPWANAEKAHIIDWGPAKNHIPETIAKYIWYGSRLSHSYFRKTFDLEQKPSSATLYIFVDDDYKVYINGTLIDNNANGSTDPTAQYTNIANYLVAGKNVIAIDALDVHSPQACVLADLRMN